ncbi:hypothetical protein QUF63_10780 [Anaerolineales bacterium HSG25]|nr:hypothetical protein [Anaerolineales bacterium HSG25]
MRRYLIVSLICLMPLLTPCGSRQSTSPAIPAGAEQQIEQTPLAGGEFNKFFPQDSGAFEVVYSQEKEGFAQAKLKQQGADIATLSISDTAANPNARKKFQASEWMIADYPAASSGSQGTAILVSDRFQVQVRAQDNALDADEREVWLSRFDLAGLSNLE